MVVVEDFFCVERLFFDPIVIQWDWKDMVDLSPDILTFFPNWMYEMYEMIRINDSIIEYSTIVAPRLFIIK